MKIIAVLLAALSFAACSDSTGPEDGGDWNFTNGTDRISGQPWAEARVGLSMTLIVAAASSSANDRALPR